MYAASRRVSGAAGERQPSPVANVQSVYLSKQMKDYDAWINLCYVFAFFFAFNATRNALIRGQKKFPVKTNNFALCGHDNYDGAPWLWGCRGG